MTPAASSIESASTSLSFRSSVADTEVSPWMSQSDYRPAARTLWHDVAAHWRAYRPTGKVLYRYALVQAKAADWRLNWNVKGHRVSDFPHAE